MQHIMAHSGGMQEWVIQIPSIPILVSVLFPSSLHLKYFRIKFLLLVILVLCTQADAGYEAYTVYVQRSLHQFM